MAEPTLRLTRILWDLLPEGRGDFMPRHGYP